MRAWKESPRAKAGNRDRSRERSRSPVAMDRDRLKVFQGWLMWQGRWYKPVDISDNADWRFVPTWGWAVRWKTQLWKPARFRWSTNDSEWVPYYWIRVA